MISRIRFGPWHRFRAWLNGMIDARRGQPDHSQAPLTAAEQRMLEIARGCIDDVYRRGEMKYHKLLVRCHKLATKVIEREEPADGAEQEKNAAKDNRDRYLNGNGGRIPRSQLNWRTYIALMSVLGIGEGAFNFIVFQVFRENLPFTFLMSLAVMAGLPALGHFAGMSTRHRKSLLGWILIFVGLAALSGITYLRISFLQSQASPSPDSPSISTPAMAFAYFFLSVLIFVVAIAVAYFYHEPDENLDGLKKDLEKKERKWSSLKHRYTSCRSCFLAVFGPLDSTRASAARTADGLRDAGIELIAIYRRANRNWRRRGDQTPAYFQSYDNAKLKFDSPPPWIVQKPEEQPEEILRRERYGQRDHGYESPQQARQMQPT